MFMDSHASGPATSACFPRWEPGTAGGELGEAGAALVAGAGRQAGGGAPGVVLLPGVECVQDALVADCQQAGDPQC